jgi:prepilin-type N-terminal cleavage/methylation domain-containing protein
MKKRVQKAFTLIELLVVIAITTILLTLIAIPLVEGFRLTRTGQAFAEAQEKARLIAERISREIGGAAAVLDNSVPASAVEIRLPLGTFTGGGPPPPATTEIQQDAAARYGSLYLSYAKIDIIPAAKGDPGNPTFNPGRNRTDPTLDAPIGQVTVPVAPGQTLIRYFIGLKDPARQYLNPWAPNVFGATTGTENLFVLFRAEVSPYIVDPQTQQWVPNTTFFPVDGNGRVIINDPGFFVRDPFQFVDNLPAHQARAAAWRARATIVSQDLRSDFIVPEIDEATEDAVYEAYPPLGGTYIPKVRTLVAFSPLRVSNESAAHNNVKKSGVEVIDLNQRTAPEYYQTEMLGWSTDSLVRLFHEDPSLLSPYYLARWRQPSGGGNMMENFDAELVWFEPGVDIDEYNDGDVLFGISAYMRAADAGPALIGDYITTGLALTDFHIFTVDAKRGRLVSTFPAANAFGLVPAATADTSNQNFNGWQNSPTRTQYDPSGSLSRRFIDLRLIAPGGGNAFNPLDANILGYSADATITTGSETVMGPDQRPGPNFGNPIRYSRVAANQKPGLNQYKINYTDIAEPTDYMTMLGVPDPMGNPDVQNYIQPRFKKGYVEFNSDPTLTMPAIGNITMEFKVQFNEPNDVVVVDYDSAQRIQVELILRRFPGASDSEAQAVTVKETVSVRNFLR